MDKGHLLVATETIDDFTFTKFPGGGVEFGEGIIDALSREIQEELGVDIEAPNHLYTTHFFQRSAFYQNEQLISVYYSIALKGTIKQMEKDESTSFKKHHLTFKWIPINELTPDVFSFPVDQHVAKTFLLKA